ncbi:MAG: orotate phosphoribosyltransferase [Sulfurovum sp.]|nr:MAG: orotate phosphoribosyltransferase [Sulfurovum sp.]
MDIEKVYKDSGALLEGHFILSSGNHSRFYLQSAKVLEQPQTAEMLAKALAEEIRASGIHIDTVVAPALGGILAGYELARALGVRSLFVERKEGKMELRRGFEISQGEKILICEDIITTGGSAMEAMEIITQLGGEVVAFGALANRGFCKRVGSQGEAKSNCKLPCGVSFFALGDFEFEIYSPEDCSMCKEGSIAIKPGSRNA